MRALRSPVALAALALLVAAPEAWGAARSEKRKAAPRAPAVRADAPLAERLAAMARRPPVPRSEFAVAVQRLGDAEPLLLVNAEKPLILASTTKLFTSAAALERLGTAYRFRTRLYADEEIGPDGVLPGPLVVVGGGDPAISGRLYDDDPLAVFRPWADSLARRGLREVKGGLLLDTSFFDDVRSHPDWPGEQEQYWWQAPISALSYNDNVVLVRATGGGRPGAPAILGFYPAGPPLMSLIGRVVTARTAAARVGVSRGAGSRTVVASGIVGRRRTWSGDVTVPDPPLYLAAAFSQVLRDAGVAVDGETRLRTEPVPAGAPGKVLLHTHETPIVPVLSVCNKRSQSFFAEQVLKTLGAERRGRGTWQNGLAEVADFLRSLGLDPARYELADGSGRSRNNRAPARDYLDFLTTLATRWDKFPLFDTTLAVTGDVEGSLRNRMLGRYTRYQVHAKTGNIAGVVTLCGYVTGQSGARYAFAILINGGVSDGRGHAWQDRFVTELARFG